VESDASEVGAWSEAARITFAMAPNLAGAERVFSLLKILFGSNQDTALSDSIRGPIILCYTTPSELMNYANEHSEKARPPYTNGPRDVPRCGL
jgi:hypothetical protein